MTETRNVHGKEELEQIAAVFRLSDELRSALSSLMHSRLDDELNVQNQVSTSAQAVIAELVEYIRAGQCQHLNTHRGGVLWEVCDDCGAKAADDEGGLKRPSDPEVVTRALSFLSRTDHND